MDRFKLTRTVFTYGDYGCWERENIELQVSLPYKNCFGKSKRIYKTIYSMDLEELAKYSLKSEKEIINFLLNKYQEKRQTTKNVRNLRRIY